MRWAGGVGVGDACVTRQRDIGEHLTHTHDDG